MVVIFGIGLSAGCKSKINREDNLPSLRIESVFIADLDGDKRYEIYANVLWARASSVRILWGII